MSDVEEVILQQDPYGPARDTSALLRGYGGFRSRLQQIGAQQMQTQVAQSSADAGFLKSQDLGFYLHNTSTLLRG